MLPTVTGLPIKSARARFFIGRFTVADSGVTGSFVALRIGPHKESKLDSDKNFRQLQFRICGQDFDADFCFGFLDLIEQRAGQRLILRQPLQAHKGVAAAIRRENGRRKRFDAIGGRQMDRRLLVRRERVNRLHKAEIFLCRQARRLSRE